MDERWRLRVAAAGEAVASVVGWVKGLTWLVGEYLRPPAEHGLPEKVWWTSVFRTGDLWVRSEDAKAHIGGMRLSDPLPCPEVDSGLVWEDGGFVRVSMPAKGCRGPVAGVKLLDTGFLCALQDRFCEGKGDLEIDLVAARPYVARDARVKRLLDCYFLTTSHSINWDYVDKPAVSGSKFLGVADGVADGRAGVRLSIQNGVVVVLSIDYVELKPVQ